MLSLLLVLQVAGSISPSPRVERGAGGEVQDSLPRITLNEALQRASRLDPNYVTALGAVGTAEWGRRAAFGAFILPSLTVALDYTKYSVPFFNIGSGRLQSTSTTFQATARYEIFSIRKFAELSRSRAALDEVEAGSLEARFTAAVLTEADFYEVLANEELARLSDDRVRRASEAFQVARARVLSGAAVLSDSLELFLELTRSRVEQLRQASALRVSRLELGRRVGIRGPVSAVPLDSVSAAELPISLSDAVDLALEQGPQYRVARAAERGANALLRSRQSDYLPTLTATGSHTRFDTKLFPNARTVSSIDFGISLPIWNNGQREIAVSQARVNRNVAEAIRTDLERAALADVTQAYEAYTTARATVDLQQTAVLVARENYRVQEVRYRSGASTILDLLSGQVTLAEAEAALVQSRFSVRLALAGLEAIVGRRLFDDRVLP
ncbi:MAG: TolC family protein [Gemmatimonadota bacterium]